MNGSVIGRSFKALNFFLALISRFWLLTSITFGSSAKREVDSHTLPAMQSTSLSPPPSLNGTNKGISGSASPLNQIADDAPKRKHIMTPTELQALQLQKLLANPDKEVKIPQPAREKELRAPRETIKNVSGSSAGAGSGEFHVYKHARRREYERIKLMEDKAKKEKEKEEYEARQKMLQEQVSAKTNKNRAKRDKKKLAKMAAKGDVSKKEGADVTNDVNGQGSGDEDSGISKRRRINAEGTEQIVFRKKDDDDSDEE
jgi:hypothetical protein